MTKKRRAYASDMAMTLDVDFSSDLRQIQVHEVICEANRLTS
jgi:hypothetical protein